MRFRKVGLRTNQLFLELNCTQLHKGALQNRRTAYKVEGVSVPTVHFIRRWKIRQPSISQLRANQFLLKPIDTPTLHFQIRQEDVRCGVFFILRRYISISNCRKDPLKHFNFATDPFFIRYNISGEKGRPTCFLISLHCLVPFVSFPARPYASSYQNTRRLR